MTKTKSDSCPATTPYGTKLKVMSFADERKTMVNCYVENKEADYFTTIRLDDLDKTPELFEFLGIEDEKVAAK